MYCHNRRESYSETQTPASNTNLFTRYFLAIYPLAIKDYIFLKHISQAWCHDFSSSRFCWFLISEDKILYKERLGLFSSNSAANHQNIYIIFQWFKISKVWSVAFSFHRSELVCSRLYRWGWPTRCKFFQVSSDNRVWGGCQASDSLKHLQNSTITLVLLFVYNHAKANNIKYCTSFFASSRLVICLSVGHTKHF